MNCVLCDGLIDSNVFRPVIRSPPMTIGYSRPNSPFTFSSAASMAARFSGFEKSVSGSFVNSGSMDGSPSAPVLQRGGGYVLENDTDGNVRRGAAGSVVWRPSLDDS